MDVVEPPQQDGADQRRLPLYPDFRYYRKKLQRRAENPSEFPVFDYPQTIAGRVRFRRHGEFLQAPRNDLAFHNNHSTPGPSYLPRMPSIKTGFINFSRPPSLLDAKLRESSSMPGPSDYQSHPHRKFRTAGGYMSFRNNASGTTNISKSPAPHDYKVIHTLTEKIPSSALFSKVQRFGQSSAKSSTVGPAKYNLDYSAVHSPAKNVILSMSGRQDI